MNRQLVFHSGDGSRMSPSALYVEDDFEPVAVRIYAEVAPNSEAKFNVYDDGVSIFSNNVNQAWDINTGQDITGAADTTIGLSPGQVSEELAERFNDNVIEAGSWVYCNVIHNGGGKNFTVIVELEPIEVIE